MQISLSLLKTWFAEYNAKYFGRALPEPQFAVGSSRTRLGSMSWKTRSRLLPNSTYAYTIRISRYYDLDEASLKDVLLHEMIHLYIVSKHLKDTSPHGVLFRRFMEQINSHGHNIQVATKIGNTVGIAQKKRRRARIIFVAETDDGKQVISVVSRGYVAAINRCLKAAPNVKSVEWYVSDNDYFANFPAVRTPRGRAITPDVYQKIRQYLYPI